MNKKALMLGLAAATVVSPAAAQQVYSAPTGLQGNQGFTGTMGLDFTVNAPVTVTSVGVFDGSSNGLFSNLSATIYDASGTALFAPVTFATGTQSSGQAYIFRIITPLVLTPGSYQVAAWGYNGSEINYNTFGNNPGPITFNTAGGRLAAAGTRYSPTAGVQGTIVDNGLTRYGAGSFIVAAVPEPATWAMMLLGFGMVGFGLRSRRKVTARVAYA